MVGEKRELLASYRECLLNLSGGNEGELSNSPSAFDKLYFIL